MYDDLLAREIRAGWDAIWRNEIAQFCLGPKGTLVAEDEWERLADEMHENLAAYFSARG